ncbi:MFS transporter [Paenibacillus soyae]|uniref:MFS transporter n=1 Tax=Paenibacillus soyae TaxID=2969249 RepID=A0A9X2S7M9_9BACL|nr:MFS transporter [Paenibacillus soyae]MCR2803509.1 MFS transporter [Paenibacillus soyae]
MPNLWKLYAIRFFYNLIPAYVIERLFWEERGMTIPMVVMTEILFAVTIVLLEVPTGIIADKWGRKRMIVLSACLGCLEFLILIFSTEFWHFALVVFLAAIGSSAASGAENALLYDSLLQDKSEARFEKYLGRLNAVDIVSTMLAALSGSLLAGKFGFEFNYWLSFGSMIVASVLTLLLKEPKLQAADEEEQAIPLRTYWTESIRFFRLNPSVYVVMMAGMAIGAAITYVDEFWQLYLERVHIPVAAFGLFSAGLFVIRLPGNLLAYKLKDRLSLRTIIVTVTLLSAAGYAYAAWAKDISGIAALFLVCLIAGIVEPLASGYLHHRIDSAMRATIDSFQSLLLNAALIVVGAGFGYFASKLDLVGGFAFLAAFCLAFAVYFVRSSNLEKAV